MKLITVHIICNYFYFGSRSTISSSASAGQFEQGMGKAFGLWNKESTEEAFCSKELPLLNLANGYPIIT
jgi:hypothetical protein